MIDTPMLLVVVERGHIGSLAYNSFRWRGSRIFNALPPGVRNMSKCGVNVFKRKLDNFLSQIVNFLTAYSVNSSTTALMIKFGLGFLIF